MGRGTNTNTNATVAAAPRPSTRGHALLGRRRGAGNSRVVRDLARQPRIADKEEWKRIEDEWAAQAVEHARARGVDAMRQPGQWAEHMADFGAFPEYGMANRLWAQSQILAKQEAGVDISMDALVLSPTWWEALGRRVKAEYLKPNWKFENQPKRRRWGYDYRREWSADFAIEQTQPFREWIAIPEVVRDENGNVQYGPDGRAVTRLKKGPFGHIKGYGTFVAYHENATEGLDGGPPPEIAAPSWHQATGTDEDARRLFNEVVHIARSNGISVDVIAFDEQQTSSMSRDRLRSIAGTSAAYYDRERQTVKVSDSVPPAERAVAALGALLEHWDAQQPRGENANIARYQQIQRLGRESALYAVSGLYGLQQQRPRFAGISDLADDSRGYDDLARDVQRRVRAVMECIHPVMRAKARMDSQSARERRRPARRARRSRQRRAR
jgi:hypothetical protein